MNKIQAETAIPIPAAAWNWEAVHQTKIRECGEALVSLSYFPEEILPSPQYYIQKIEGTIPEIYARKSVLKKLGEAAELLPCGCRFVVFDCWRPLQVQLGLFSIFQKRLGRKYPSLPPKKIRQMASAYVACPDESPSSSFPHGTGGAVDLSIADENGLLLNMGTDFDDFTEKSGTSYYEKRLKQGPRLKPEEAEALRNRRLLYSIMIRSGFTNYTGEWWHYDYGNQNWASLTGRKSAVYGPSSPAFPWKDATV